MSILKELQNTKVESVEELEKIQHDFVKKMNQIGVTDIKDLSLSSSSEDKEETYGWILKG